MLGKSQRSTCSLEKDGEKIFGHYQATNPGMPSSILVGSDIQRSRTRDDKSYSLADQTDIHYGKRGIHAPTSTVSRWYRHRGVRISHALRRAPPSPSPLGGRAPRLGFAIITAPRTPPFVRGSSGDPSVPFANSFESNWLTFDSSSWVDPGRPSSDPSRPSTDPSRTPTDPSRPTQPTLVVP